MENLPIEIRHLEGETDESSGSTQRTKDDLRYKSYSFSDILANLPAGLVRKRRWSEDDEALARSALDKTKRHAKTKSVSFSTHSLDSAMRSAGGQQNQGRAVSDDAVNYCENLLKETGDRTSSGSRPKLVKQKKSLSEDDTVADEKRKTFGKQASASLNENLLRHDIADKGMKTLLLLKNGLSKLVQYSFNKEEGSTKESTQQQTVTQKRSLYKTQHSRQSQTVDTETEVDKNSHNVQKTDSDSSKDSSFQSDTSVDSEDSFVSVIYVSKTDAEGEVQEISAESSPCSPRSPVDVQTPSPKNISQNTTRTSIRAGLYTIPESSQSNIALSSESTSPVKSTVPELPKPITLAPVETFLNKKTETVKKADKSPSSAKSTVSQFSSLVLGENLEIICKPGVQAVRNLQNPKQAPRVLTFEVFNPETDDADSDTSRESTPSSVISVINDESWPPVDVLDSSDEKGKGSLCDLTDTETVPDAQVRLYIEVLALAEEMSYTVINNAKQQLREKQQQTAKLDEELQPLLTNTKEIEEQAIQEKKALFQQQAKARLSSSISGDSLQSDSGGALRCHRYYHVFREGELDRLIERHVANLDIVSSYYDHANWCIIAEKVQVWTI